MFIVMDHLHDAQETQFSNGSLLDLSNLSFARWNGSLVTISIYHQKNNSNGSNKKVPAKMQPNFCISSPFWFCSSFVAEQQDLSCFITLRSVF